MNLLSIRSIALAATLLCTGTLAAQPRTGPPTRGSESAGAVVGKTAPTFTLTDVDGKAHTLADYKGKVVVLEWFNAGCPWSGKESRNSVHATGRVKKLIEGAKKVQPDVVYLLIDSSADRPKEKIVEEDKAARTKFSITQPILIDHDGKVGKAYGARTTPHMFVIDAEGVLRYSGAFGARQMKPGGESHNFVLAAISKMKAGEAIEPAQTRPWGCGVKYQR
jgi:peroxiredoxin